MTHTLSAGQQVVNALARAYAQNPALWTTGWGTAKSGKKNGYFTSPTNFDNLQTCCIDMGLMVLSRDYGGAPALREARALVMTRLGVHTRYGIHWWNDSRAKSADYVAAMLFSAGRKESAPRHESRFFGTLKRSFIEALATSGLKPLLA